MYWTPDPEEEYERQLEEEAYYRAAAEAYYREQEEAHYWEMWQRYRCHQRRVNRMRGKRR